jgi:hypothetical protein
VAGKSPQTLAKEKEKELRAKEKADEEKRRKEEAALFNPVQATQKVPFGVDPKTVLCEFFKAGRCEKGSKCKFSHDRDVGRRVDKRNLYEDNREDKLEGASWILIHGFLDAERRMGHRHYGQMGRGEATECYLIQAWESTDNHRSTVSSFGSRTSFDSFPTSSLPFRSYASILSRPSSYKSERKGSAPLFH